MKTLTKLEEAIAKRQYGRDAKPTLIADKSIEGLIRANMGERTKVQTFNLFKLNLRP